MKRSIFLASAGAVLLMPLRARADSLASRVATIARAVPGTVGIYARTLAEGAPVIAYNAYRSFPAASTIKMLILTTAFAMEEHQPGTLDEELVTHRRDLIGGSDFMSRAEDGARFTVRQLLVPMIQLSDNTASNRLIDHFGVTAINATGLRAGLMQTHLERKFLDFAAIVHHEDNVTTPADMGDLLYQIESVAREGSGSLVSAPHARQMIGIMLGQTDREGIPAGLPARIQVANKTGAIDGTRNDVAIIEPFADSPFILSIFSKNVEDYAAMYAAMRKLASLTFGALGRSGL